MVKIFTSCIHWNQSFYQSYYYQWWWIYLSEHPKQHHSNVTGHVLLEFSLCLVRSRFFVSKVFSYKHIRYFEKQSHYIIFLLIITLNYFDIFLEEVWQPTFLLTVMSKIQSGPVLGLQRPAERWSFPQDCLPVSHIQKSCFYKM